MHQPYIIYVSQFEISPRCSRILLIYCASYRQNILSPIKFMKQIIDYVFCRNKWATLLQHTYKGLNYCNIGRFVILAAIHHFLFTDNHRCLIVYIILFQDANKNRKRSQLLVKHQQRWGRILTQSAYVVF